MLPYIHIAGQTIPSYGLCIAIALIASSCLAFYRSSKKGLPIDPLLLVIAVITGGAMIGAKILYIVVSIPLSQLWEQIKVGDFSMFSGAGLVFYGGLIFGIISAFLGAKLVRIKLTDYESSIVPSIPLAHAIGRVGCFLAGCCYGRPYTGPLSVTYTIHQNNAHVQIHVFPVQLLESALNICVCIILLVYARKPRAKYAMIKLYLLFYALERFCLEFLRGDLERGIYGGLSLSQWISCIAVVLLLIDKLWISRLYTKNR